MFSAIAMMAFSVSSMGNTITCQEEEKELSVEKLRLLLIHHVQMVQQLFTII